LGLNRAVVLLAKKLDSVKILGPHPKGGDVTLRRGRFGPYVQHGSTVANLPKGVASEDMDLAAAVSLLAEKGKPLAGRGGRGKAGGKGGAKAGARKPAARRTAVG
jgi:DNA topoisomerase-1